MQSLIFLVTLWTSSSLISCANLKTKAPALSEPRIGPRSRVFNASYTDVWEATQKTLALYPLRVNNIDVGLLETDAIKSTSIWHPPHIKKKAYNGQSYSIKVRVIQGQVRRKSSVKVTILKSTTKTRDFFSNPKELPSDGLEEKSLLYRIQRELIISRALTRAAERRQNR